MKQVGMGHCPDVTGDVSMSSTMPYTGDGVGTHPQPVLYSAPYTCKYKSWCMVRKSASLPLYLQIQDQIYDQIRSGALSPGAQVASEHELSAQFNVSRMTARKALDGLIAKGYLFRQQGKGTFVSEDLVNYGLSTMLSFSRTLRARGYNVITKVLRQEVIPAPGPVIEKLNLRPDSRVILIRRLRLIESKPVAIHTAYMDYKVYAPVLNVDLSRESLLESIERLCNVRVAFTRDTVRAALVNPEDMELFDVPAGSPVLEVEGVSFSENAQPTRLSRAVYRGDCFKMGVTNTSTQATSISLADTLLPL
jgi:GntR family transcriptional regulator